MRINYTLICDYFNFFFCHNAYNSAIIKKSQPLDLLMIIIVYNSHGHNALAFTRKFMIQVANLTPSRSPGPGVTSGLRRRLPVTGK